MKQKIITALLFLIGIYGESLMAQSYGWTTIAGSYLSLGSADGTNNTAMFNNPQGIVVDGAGNIFVADTANYTIRKIIPTNGNWVVTTIAGSSAGYGNTDGPGSAARFRTPGRLQLDGYGNLYLQDYYTSQTIRRLTPVGTNWLVNTIDNNNGAAGAPGWFAVDISGNVYTTSNYTLIKLAPFITNGLPTTNYSVTTLAGTAGLNGSADGTNNAARFNVSSQIFGLDVNGVIYLSDSNHIRTVTPVGTNWIVTTTAIVSQSGMSRDSTGNIFGIQGSTIQFLAAGTSNWVSIGGTNSAGGVDGTNNQARFASPVGLGIDSSGNVLVADTGGDTIRRGVNLAGVATGSLNVNLATDSGTNNSMAWRVDAGSWQTSGAVVSNLQTGTHVISFQPVYGWVTPSNLTVNIVLNQTATLSAVYVQQYGSLAGFILPTNAISAGGLWQLDYGSWQSNGTVLTGLTIGTHTVAFTNLLGWATPTNQTVVISPNSQSTITGNYILLGAIGVTLSPPGIATNNVAQWQIDGGIFNYSGVTVSNMVPGSHTISFLPILGWITPSNQIVTVQSGQTTNLTATYTALGGIQVTIVPTNAVTAGAMWSLDNGTGQVSGTTISNLGLGSHTISFSILNSWIVPSNQNVTVVSGQTTNITATYVALGSLQVVVGPTSIVGTGAVWQVDGGAWQVSGAIITNLAAGNHTLGYTNIFGWAVPANQSVTVSLNQTNVVNASYTQLFGSVQVVLAPAGVVSLGAQWQVDGGPWQASGAIISNLLFTNHVVAYSSVFGWTTPTNQTFVISSTQTTRITTSYSGQGLLQVFVSPAAAAASGALWQVDGGNWLTNGTVVAGLSRGTHAISYKYAYGWLAPANQTVSVLPSQTTITNGNYTALSYNYRRIAGSNGWASYADGTNSLAWFNSPAGIVVDLNSNVYIADNGNSVIRKLNLTTNGWVSSTIAGQPGVTGNSDGVNNQARFDYPTGLAVDTNGNVYVADQVNATIRELTTDGTNWTVTTLAGQAGSYGSLNGTNNTARFYYPAGLALDNLGNIYVADSGNSTIRKVAPVITSTQVFITNSVVVTNTLYFTNWVVSTIAGAPLLPGSSDGANGGAKYNWPSGLVVDPNGIIYVADTGNNTIRKITTISGNYISSTICGTAGVNGWQDGTNTATLFDGPNAISLDAAGNLYVVDSYSSVIRKISPLGSLWYVNTIGGQAYNFGNTDGINAAARFYFPSGVAVDNSGLVYVADSYNQTIRLGSILVPPYLSIALAGANYALNWLTTTGITYQVQFKTNLLQPSWANLGSSIYATNAAVSITDSNANAQKYYRLMESP